jgi:hypothetical protein
VRCTMQRLSRRSWVPSRCALMAFHRSCRDRPTAVRWR